MQWGGPEFVLAIIAISTIGWLVSSWIRARHGYPIENEWSGMTGKDDPQAAKRIAELTNENDALRGQIDRLEQRLGTVERIVTDPAARTAREIEELR